MPNVCKIDCDATAKSITIKVVDPATGNMAVGYDLIDISLQDVADLGFNIDGINRTLAVRWLYFKDPNNSCQWTRMLVIGSSPELAPAGTP
jgi:hypothetical protein